MHPIIFRTLSREYRLHTPSPEAREQLRFIEATPDLPGSELEPVDIEVAARDGFLAAMLPSGKLAEGSANHLLGILHELVMRDVIASERGAPLLHGATVVIGGRRLLLVAHKGAGKSTLSLHLALHGHGVEGDEHLVVRAAEVIARPRTLRLKAGTLSLVAGLPAAILDAPSVAGWDGGLIRAVSPALAGSEWVIRPGPLAGIVFLVANHGGRSAARRIAAGDAFQRLMREVLLPPSGVAMAAGRIRQLSQATPAFQLLLGELDTAEWHLANIAALLT